MTAPGIAARRFLISCLLGLGLGFVYGFLRPFRRRFPKLGDTLFLVAAGWAWLQLSFRVCQGDLRIGYCFGLLAGTLIWELSLGRFLRPV